MTHLIRWWSVTPMLLAIALVAVNCRKQQLGEGVERECPHDWVWNTRPTEDTTEFVVPRGQLSGPDRITNVPEFHDCQRFVVGEGTDLVYDSLFAIFAVERLSLLDTLLWLDGSMPLRPGASEQEPEQRPDSITIVSRDDRRLTLTRRHALPAAEIYAEGNYQDLLLERGFSCLYLYRREGRWQAKMVNFGHVEQDCSEPIDPDTIDENRRLEVIPDQPLGNSNPNDYPPVARWDWDSVNSLHYIGIRCAAAYCEVGPGGFQPSDVQHAVPAGAGPELKRTRTIPGWYDEQFLAPASGGPGPTRIRGTIFPAPDLADLTWSTPGTWDTVAFVMLTSSSPGYQTKFNLERTDPAGPYNVVELCRGGAEFCLEDVPAQEIPSCAPSDPNLCDLDTEPWWAKITSPSNKVAYQCVRRCTSVGDSIPATARWRWLADDEGKWIRCVHGCCDLIGNQ